jgi:hypothetical protein
VAKVKKRPAVTGGRNVKASKTKGLTSAKRSATPAAKRAISAKRPAPPAAKRSTSAKRPTPSPAKRATSAGGRAGGRKTKSSRTHTGKRPAPPPAVRVQVRELDPQRMCGAGTSVQFLYRVDEHGDGRASAHLVFFDRHGWYCEHGRSCPAVAHARKHNGRHPGQIARVS